MTNSPDAYLPPKAVIQKTGLSRTTLWRLARRQEFPAPRQLSANRIGFPADAVEAWLASRPATV